MPPRTRTWQFSCSTLSLLLCTFFCAFDTSVSCITFFLGLAASHCSKDPPSFQQHHILRRTLRPWPIDYYTSPQLIGVRWCCKGRAKREKAFLHTAKMQSMPWSERSQGIWIIEMQNRTKFTKFSCIRIHCPFLGLFGGGALTQLQSTLKWIVVLLLPQIFTQPGNWALPSDAGCCFSLASSASFSSSTSWCLSHGTLVEPAENGAGDLTSSLPASDDSPSNALSIASAMVLQSSPSGLQ